MGLSQQCEAEELCLKSCQQKFESALPKGLDRDPISKKSIIRYPLENSRLGGKIFLIPIKNLLDLGSKCSTLCEKLG